MGKVVDAVALSVLVASAGVAAAQEIGIVSAEPNAATGELIVDIPARPDGEKIYIVRNGTLVTEATVKTSGGQGGTIISVPAEAATTVQVGDRISLSPSLTRQLPASAYQTAVGDVLPPHPGQQQLARASGGRTDLVMTERAPRVFTEVGAPEPPAAVAAPAPTTGVAVAETTQLEKGESVVRTSEVTAVIAEPTPRDMGIPLFPAPVAVEAGIAAPYGQGLAAAAPVGTPYLRSPAFAGPPVIYMPQTVTRVLLPGATPYPSNIMSPPAQYVYASAPFLRTDIYTSLPYGTFYWPQGYAGTTPVEPQVPAYVTAPASAILSTEADYAAGRYEPGVANEETLNPITAGINTNLVGSTVLAGEESGIAASVGTTVEEPSVSSLTVVQPGPEAGVSAETIVPDPPVAVEPFPVLSDTMESVSATTTSVVTEPAVTGLPDLPPTEPALPELPDLSPSVSPTPAAVSPTPATPLADLPDLPPPPTEVAAVAPTPATDATPASMMPSLPTPAVPPAPANVIIVDNQTPGGVTLEPETAWTESAATADSHEGSSLLATVEPGVPKTATFNATIPADGQYDIALWWVSGTPQFRASSVPVTVQTATGPQQVTIDQTQPGQWTSLGSFALKAGQNVPVVTVSTDGITPQGSTVSVSVDAMRITPQ